MEALSADWLAICRRIVAAQRRVFEGAPGIEERTVYEGVGEGGDRTLAIDRLCEDAVFAELEGWRRRAPPSSPSPRSAARSASAAAAGRGS